MKTSNIILSLLVGGVIVYIIGRKMGWWGTGSNAVTTPTRVVVTRPITFGRVKEEESPDNLTVVPTSDNNSTGSGFVYIPITGSGIANNSTGVIGFLKVPASSQDRYVSYRGVRVFIPASVNSPDKLNCDVCTSVNMNPNSEIPTLNSSTGRYYFTNGREAVKCCDARDTNCHCTSWHWSASSDCNGAPCGSAITTSSGYLTRLQNAFHNIPITSPSGTK